MREELSAEKRSGRYYPEMGEKVGRNREIVERMMDGHSSKVIASDYGITQSMVYKIAKRYRKENNERPRKETQRSGE